MTSGRAAAGCAAAFAGAITAAGFGTPATMPARRVPAIEVAGPADDTLDTVTPSFFLRATGFDPGGGGTTLTLQISTRADFQGPLVIDTSVVAPEATIVLAEPLPELANYYWRGVARDQVGNEAVSSAVGPHHVPAWLVLVSPNAPSGTLLDVRRPQFVWSSLTTAVPPGPWRYDITITNTATRQSTTAIGLGDTTFTPARDLDANTSYRWSVTARLARTGDSVHVASTGSFVITSNPRVLATLLYQNFPNPFPTATTRTTCVWFDLGGLTSVRLEVRDLRGNLVRRVFPAGGALAILPGGQYGRAGAGCDARFAWDGRADDGRFAPAGVYLLRLQTSRDVLIRKMLWRGSP